MSRSTTRLLKAALAALHYSGADSLAAPLSGGAGVIFMLHQVTPDPVKDFEPNRILRITPAFLETVVRHILDAGFEPIAMDRLPERLAGGEAQRPFACFTFDDGYRDNRDHALPIFQRYGVPFTIYVPSAFADGEGDLWWLTLEAAIARLDAVAIDMQGATREFATGTATAKAKAFHAIYWWLRGEPERRARSAVAGLAHKAGYSPNTLCRSLVMDWSELRTLAREPLVTIGAHTCTHYALAKLDAVEARQEMSDSITRIEHEIGRPCRHFSYPYGDEGSAGEREFQIARELGVATAVTTRKGLITAAHATRLTALPRLSLNGDFQDERYLKVLLSGVPFALRDGVRRALGRAA
ncbi:MAG: polysaccharide deacetylase family protein [Hyphomicrobium sp.]